MSWQPSDHVMVPLLDVLQRSQDPTADQREVVQQLESFAAVPEACAYCAYILKDEGRAPEIRQISAILLKNLLWRSPDTVATLSEAARATVQETLAGMIRHSLRFLRRASAAALPAFVAQQGWDGIADALVAGVRGPDAAAQDGSLQALHNVAEDAPAALLVTPGNGGGDTIARLMVDEVLRVVCQVDGKLREEALETLRMMYNALAVTGLDLPLLPRFLSSLFHLTQDESPGVRRAVCQGLAFMLTVPTGADHLRPHLKGIMDFILACLSTPDADVALQACEFFSTYAEAQGTDLAAVQPHLPEIVPRLLNKMDYQDDDDDVLAAEEGELPERPSEARPFVPKGLLQGAGAAEDEEGGDSGWHWSLRKAAAQALDLLCTVFDDAMLPSALPVIHRKLGEGPGNWKSKESATLALGAMAAGCYNGFTPHISGIYATLLPQLDHPHPLVRSITCWTLSRFMNLFVSCAPIEVPPGLNLPPDAVQGVLSGIIARVRDRNRRVQEAACSSLANLAEDVPQGELSLQLEHLLRVFASGIEEFGPSSLVRLYDALASISEAAGPVMGTPEHLAAIVPAILGKWQGMGDTDRGLLPLLEGLTSVVQAAGAAFAPYAGGVVERALHIAQMHMTQRHSPDFDCYFVIVAMDLLSALVEALGASCQGALEAGKAAQLAMACVADDMPDIRQCGFSVAGEMAKSCVSLLSPVAANLVGLCLDNADVRVINTATVNASNNACWCLGELTMRLDADSVRQYARAAAERLYGILLASRGHFPRSIVDNAAIALGRVAMRCDDEVAPFLEHLVVPWSAALDAMGRDGDEKSHACLGLCHCVAKNPRGALVSPQAFAALCTAFASWSPRRLAQFPTLQDAMKQTFESYQQLLTKDGTWEAHWGAVPQKVRAKLVPMLSLPWS